MNFLHPIWLLLLVPLVLTLSLRKRSRWLGVPRLLIYLLAVLAMAGLVIYPQRQAGALVVVADRSASMPGGNETMALETVKLLHQSKLPNTSLGVVSFGKEATVERSPSDISLSEFTSIVDVHGSNLNDALDLALGMLPAGNNGRILVISDGNWTGSDPRASALRAAAVGVAIDYRLETRNVKDDVAIARLSAPQWVEDGQGFMINAWVTVPSEGELQYKLLRDNQVIAQGKKQFAAGEQRLSFRDLAVAPGTQSYKLTITSPQADALPQNNSADLLVGVRGKRALLLVSPNSATSFAPLLINSGFAVKVRTPQELTWSLTELSSFAAVILENVPAAQITRSGMENLAAWVQSSGGGLYMTGGEQSFGPGGYYRSPLEPIMPVSMELRREHRKFSMALVVVADRSGSMAAAVGNMTKMDLANIAAAEVVRILSPNDEFGMLAVDTEAHEVVPRQFVTNPGSIVNRVRSVASMGGGIYVYEALLAAGQMIQDSEAGARHIILFSDAADSEEPGDYEALLGKFTAAGITVSVVALGTPEDSDALLLASIAEKGGGNLYFTRDAKELPRIFSQDTFIMARSAFVDVASPVEISAGMLTVSGRNFTLPPDLGGYNLCYLRDGADLAMVSTDEYAAPIAATWFTGSGRTVCFTGEATGAYAGAFASWDQLGAFHSALAGWAAGGSGTLPDGSLVTQELRNGQLEVTLHLDPNRKADVFAKSPLIQVLRGDTGSTPQKEEVELNWSGPDSLSAVLPINGTQTLLGSVSIGKHTSVLAPARLPYSPEYSPPRVGGGVRVMAELAKMTHGVARTRLDTIWQDLPKVRSSYSLAPWLLGMAMILLLLEVLQRRTAMVSSWFASKAQAVIVVKDAPKKAEPSVKSQTTPASPNKPAQAQEEHEPAKTSSLGAALSKAKHSADKRLK